MTTPGETTATCVHGHDLDAATLVLRPGRATPVCRTCTRASGARWRLRARQAAPGAVWEQTALPGQETAL